ncbi:MAG TPA: MFS transporter, partial [Anaerolineae bacterium]|nr:MFS transporter [Anaerolineae bacterium]
MHTPQAEIKPARIRTQLLVLAISRFFLITTSRMVFSFLPSFARGLGTSEAKLQASLSSRSLVSFAVPFLIPLSEKFGRKTFLYLAMLIFSVACLLAASANSLAIFVLALLIRSLAQALYDPTMRAHLGDIVSYGQRGKAVAVTEFSWSGALLVGAPLAGLLIANYGWQSPFIWLSALGFISIGLLWRFIPAAAGAVASRFNLRQAVKSMATLPALWGASFYVGA